ncbi:hypothetical protein KVR01_001042 [Diaporthe batatas]|uniref:uncharacterized protein n=1 Tax=Diaporthe batatas TaxID=748121 RepID=UPI001D057EA3|nr:uncharacterized protein KVR01_001042 [Diaporthe batatas]KAG8170297.1 hypothetical protein KVR01_001042 [Diaporthe batatas]
MPKGRRTREVARVQLDAAEEVANLDYFDRSVVKRQKLNNGRNDRNPASEDLGEQIDDRTARRMRREADKLSQTKQAGARRASPRRGNARLSETRGGEDEDDEDEEDDDDAYEVNHARITQAMNQARNGPRKPTINGIGSLRRNKEPPHTEASSDIGEKNQEEVINDRFRTGYGATGGAPKAQSQRSRKGRDRPSQQSDTHAYTPEEHESEEHESEDESSTEIDDQAAEDTAYVEAPQQDEETETVQVLINSMGGIFKTLQHPAWTNSTRWNHDFASEDNKDGQKTCKTRSGKDLMEEAQGLNNILEEATHISEEGSEDDHDVTSAAIECLRARSADVQQHLTRMDRIVDGICRQKLRPVPHTGDSRTRVQAVKRRKAMLRDLSQRLIPMLMITVKKACGICPSEDNRSKTTLHLDCFRLQFFLRPLGWADRLHKAHERCVDEDLRTGDDDPDEVGSEAQYFQKSRETFGSQLDALRYACRRAEREIQDRAAQAERREREAEMKRQHREREYERQRVRQAEQKRKQEEQRIRDERQMDAFIQSTHALRSRQPLRDLWVQSQQRLPEHFRTQGGRSGVHSQSSGGAARPQGSPSRTAQAQPVYQSDDPFEANYRASSEQANNTSSPSSKEFKILTKAIRYDKNYDVTSMAQKLRRTERDVAMMAAFLKDSYRVYYTQQHRPIPDWAV